MTKSNKNGHLPCDAIGLEIIQDDGEIDNRIRGDSDIL